MKKKEKKKKRREEGNFKSQYKDCNTKFLIESVFHN